MQKSLAGPSPDSGAEKKIVVDLGTPDPCLAAMEAASAAVWQGKLRASAAAVLVKAASQALAVHDSRNLQRIGDLERRLKDVTPKRRRQ
jgi:hypothetical protein